MSPTDSGMEWSRSIRPTPTHRPCTTSTSKRSTWSSGSSTGSTPWEWDKHEGDWERLVVRLGANDRASETAYYQHFCDPLDPSTDYGHYTWAQMKANGYVAAGTHPTVYSAVDGHPSYPSNVDHEVFPCEAWKGLGDQTGAGGVTWDSWARGFSGLKSASLQSWYGFGGGWGRKVGGGTGWGPLGPGLPMILSDGRPAPKSWMTYFAHAIQVEAGKSWPSSTVWEADGRAVRVAVVVERLFGGRERRSLASFLDLLSRQLRAHRTHGCGSGDGAPREVTRFPLLPYVGVLLLVLGGPAARTVLPSLSLVHDGSASAPRASRSHRLVEPKRVRFRPTASNFLLAILALFGAFSLACCFVTYHWCRSASTFSCIPS